MYATNLVMHSGETILEFFERVSETENVNDKIRALEIIDVLCINYLSNRPDNPSNDDIDEETAFIQEVLEFGMKFSEQYSGDPVLADALNKNWVNEEPMIFQLYHYVTQKLMDAIITEARKQCSDDFVSYVDDVFDYLFTGKEDVLVTTISTAPDVPVYAKLYLKFISPEFYENNYEKANETVQNVFALAKSYESSVTVRIMKAKDLVYVFDCSNDIPVSVSVKDLKKAFANEHIMMGETEQFAQFEVPKTNRA